MKYIIKNEEQHEELLTKGLQYLDDNVPGVKQKLFLFAAGICSKLIEILGKEKIAYEFSLPDYMDMNFVQQLSYRIEFGVPVFLIQNNLYDKLINTHNIWPVTTAINFAIANDMAIIFNKAGLRHFKTSCVYANDALLQIVNRTMVRYEELSETELLYFYENIELFYQ